MGDNTRMKEVSALVKVGSSIAGDLHGDFLFKKGEQSRDNRGFSYFHPSSFGGCLRKTAFQYYSEFDDRFKLKETLDIRSVRRFDAGHAFHWRMQKDFSEMGILRGFWKCRSCGKVHGKDEKIGIFTPEICDCLSKDDKRTGLDLFEYEEIFLKSDPKYNFQGHCDGIIEKERGDPDSRYVVDFKTINSGGFGRLNRPSDIYVQQISIYMWLSGVHKAFIFYEDKNDHYIKEFPIIYDENEIERMTQKALRLKAILDKKKLPKKPDDYKKDKKPCREYGRTCEFASFCYGK
ncbi:MAG TPA: hypothetical protein VMZ91_12520 [Candidatus Paceibacterota bacterium]|nr:hypothetical protein [Candidatus Paceibacterota bacterium]